MKLHYFPQTRATRPRWLLEELGAPYELVRVDLGKGEHKQPPYRRIHPHGVVPALVDGDVTIFESAAICAYLADRFPEKGLAPAPGSAERGPYYQWLFYAMATAEPPVVKVFLNSRFLPVEKRSPEAVEEGTKQFGEVAAVLSAALDGKAFLLGDRFTAADVMIGSIVAWAGRLGLLDDSPVLREYARRLAERPAYRRATAD